MNLTPYAMGRFSLAFVLATAPPALALVACASEGSDEFEDTPDASTIPPPPEVDAGSADADADAACAGNDCAFFVSECTADVLCPIGPTGPFHPADPTQGLSWVSTTRALVGRSSSDDWVAGTHGAYSHYDGSTWTVMDARSQASPRVLWLAPSGEVAIDDRANLLVRGSSFVTTGEPSPGGFATAALASKPPAALFGARVVAGFAPADSSTLWIATASTSTTASALWRLVATEDGRITVKPGIAAARCPSACTRLRSMHGSSPAKVFAVGEQGAALRIDGADTETPTVTAFNTETLMGLWGVFAVSDSDVWAVGGTGTVHHYTGSTWQLVPDVPTHENLNAVWGTSSNDIWVAGDNGVVLHYDGAAWTRLKMAGLGARRPAITAIWGAPNGTVYIAGQGIALSIGGRP